jgi:hypothetical protein
LIVRQAQSRAMLCFNCLVKGRITSASSRVQDDPGFHDRFAIGELPALTEDPHPAGHTQQARPAAGPRSRAAAEALRAVVEG